MPYELHMPGQLQPPYRVKIQDNETAEEPHVTILRRSTRYRYSLRGGGFLDPRPDPKDVDKRVVDHIERHMGELREVWDRMFPHNPVGTN